MFNYKESDKRKEEQWGKHPDFIAANKDFKSIFYTLCLIAIINIAYASLLYNIYPLPTEILDFIAKTIPAIECPFEKVENAIITNSPVNWAKAERLYKSHGYTMTIGALCGFAYLTLCIFLILSGKIRPWPNLDIPKNKRLKYLGVIILMLTFGLIALGTSYFGKCDTLTNPYSRGSHVGDTLVFWIGIMCIWWGLYFLCLPIRFYIENGRISQPEINDD